MLCPNGGRVWCAKGVVSPQYGLPQDQDLVTFGKYTWSTYAEIYKGPGYCIWTMDTAQNASNPEMGAQMELMAEGSEHFQRLAQLVHPSPQILVIGSCNHILLPESGLCAFSLLFGC